MHSGKGNIPCVSAASMSTVSSVARAVRRRIEKSPVQYDLVAMSVAEPAATHGIETAIGMLYIVQSLDAEYT